MLNASEGALCCWTRSVEEAKQTQPLIQKSTNGSRECLYKFLVGKDPSKTTDMEPDKENIAPVTSSTASSIPSSCTVPDSSRKPKQGRQKSMSLPSNQIWLTQLGFVPKPAIQPNICGQKSTSLPSNWKRLTQLGFAPKPEIQADITHQGTIAASMKSEYSGTKLSPAPLTIQQRLNLCEMQHCSSIVEFSIV